MPVETADDRAVFLNTYEFGVTATFTGLSGAPTIDGIFDDPSALANANVMSTDPFFRCRTADIPSGAGDGTRLQVNATDYTIRNLEPDGTGMTVLQLEKVTGA